MAREVTLLPRHWEWLAAQPGGASVALRKLVEDARRTHAAADRLRAAGRLYPCFETPEELEKRRKIQLARGLPGAVREAGQMERVVLVEYPSLEVAVNFYEGPAYQAALAALGRDAVVRDIRIVEAAE